MANEHKQDVFHSIVTYLRTRINRVPDCGIICGSGLSNLHRALSNPITVKYSDIPAFLDVSVEGHVGEMVFGEIGDKFCMLMRGRFHYYEGYSMEQVARAVRVMAAMGCKMLLVTNAAGGVKPEFMVGDVMLIKHHMFLPGLAGIHPLVGHNDARFGPRFPPIYYDSELQQIALRAAKEQGMKLREGVYCGVSGPSYETSAEIEFLRQIGGGSVGMSTVPEVIVGAHAGMRILGLSLITNRCKGINDDHIPAPTHQEVLDATKPAEARITALVAEIVRLVNLGATPRPKAFDVFKGKAKL